jgi:hypothetical protein
LKKNIDIQEQVPNIGETEITPLEDGGVEINFEPGAMNQAQTENHYDNLAELLPEETLVPLGSELFNNYTDYKSSRQDWESSYVKGLDLLGFKYETKTQPSKVQQVPRILYLQKRLLNFKPWPTKNYSRLKDL